MLHRSVVLVFLTLFAKSAFACDAADARQQLTQIESEVLLKNAPTFQYAWEAGAIKLEWRDLQSQQDHCVAQMVLTLPEVDLKEASTFLDQNPAKRILSAAQGYAVPEPATQQVEFIYRWDNGKVQADNQHNFPLRQLHSNIEYTYQLLAQTRIAVTETQSNNTPWPVKLKQDELAQCAANTAMSKAACDCRVSQLEQRISAQQKGLIEFIRQHPYSVATGSMDSYLRLSQKVDEVCSK